MILTDKQIKQLIEAKEIEIVPYNEKKLGPVSYDIETYSVGEENNIYRLVSKESIRVSRNILGLVVPRSRIVLRGQFFSGSPLIDPGFHGRLIFLVYNPRNLLVTDLFQIIFLKVGKVEVAYNERDTSTAMDRKGFK